jgi:hypothetical protein
MVAGREIRLPLRTFKYKIMKKLFLFLAIAAVLASCKTDEPKVFQIKATDMISIKPATSAMRAAMRAKSTTGHLSALEIVKKTTEISLIMHGGTYEGVKAGRSFASEQRDTISEMPKLLMWATDVIRFNGELATDWIEATDVVFVNYNLSTPKMRDTIAYIPNATVRAAETAIRAAYVVKDMEACYAIFNAAYTFVPITGAEWRTLKANNQN